MLKFSFVLLSLVACASLDRSTSSTDQPDDTIVVPPNSFPTYPGPLTSDAGSDTCQEEPECRCDLDCGTDAVCLDGVCHQTCECDFDCGNHYECHSHVCYNPHGD